jgi:GntR family transcriptional repressor for pyruvate dehydrogenase complex
MVMCRSECNGRVSATEALPISAKLRSRYENTRTWNMAVKEHEAVLRALEARDPLAAESAMRSHLKMSEERWVGG